MSALALFVSVLLGTLFLGRPLIRALRALSVRQTAYEDAPKSHASKSGTPTMGGLLFLFGLLAVLAVRHDAPTVALVVLGLACGAIGFYDDYSAIKRGRNRGLRAREKLALTALAGMLFLFLIREEPAAAHATVLTLGGSQLAAPAFVWYPLALLAILGTIHAVNLTDGLDGLAAGTIIPPLAVFAWLGWRAGNNEGVVLVDLATAAAVLGFLAYNRHPASVFMGDTGSLALGGVLAGSAILTGSLLALPLIGGVFLAETLSVMIQVAYFKRTRKRIFRMSPLHHHFELGGWPETKVTARFWTASALLSVAGAVLVR
jgi:phospho-N-acetylmuramoyl-pentapeptide-transferase